MNKNEVIMKKERFFWLPVLLMFVFMAGMLSACSPKAISSVQVDYKDAAQFEEALNAGEDVAGKIVSFHADSLHPDSKYGYNIWAGEHLNFISEENPGIKRGDIATVSVTTTQQLDNGSWIIYYELLETDDAGKQSNTIETKRSESRSTVSNPQKKSERKLQIHETGLYVESSYVWNDTIYVNYIGLIYNPNKEKVALFPKLIATAKNTDGTILATDEQTGTVVMPGDTVPIIGRMSIVSSEIQEDSYVSYEVECKSFGDDSFIYSSARTTDFAISNVSEHSGSRDSVTGEIKNNFSEDATMLKIVAIFRKNNNIVGVESTYMDDLSVNQSKAFEIDGLLEFPEHDSVEVVAVPSL